MRLSIIIPAYNEERRIGRALDSYLDFFAARHGGQFECIVVVNGSRDRTEEVVRERQRLYPQLRVVVDPQPIGKGGALMRGFAEARGELIGFVDADGSTPPDAFQDLIEQIGDAGMIIASRWMPGSEVSPPQPWSRRVASRIFNAMVGFLFHLRIHDTQCGAKLGTREAIRTVLPQLGITQWAFDVDLLFKLSRAGYRIREIPTRWRDQYGSKVNVPRASIEMLLAITRLRLLYSPLRWVVSIYDATLARWIHRML